MAQAVTRTLVVIQLDGGNDGINTVIPYKQKAYYDARPTVALKQDEVLLLDDNVALHPSMNEIHTIFKNGKAAIVQGVGYPNPSHSHGESARIWERGTPDSSVSGGWLGRYLDLAKGSDETVNAVSVGPSLGYILVGVKEQGIVIDSAQEFRVKPLDETQDESQDHVRALNTVPCQDRCDFVGPMIEIGLEALDKSSIVQEAVAGYRTSVKYPSSNLGGSLELAAQIMGSKLNPIIIHVRTGAFDTHADQKDTHARLLKTVDEAVGAFCKDVDEKGRMNDTLILMFSEFGRRVRENGSLGTDHGTAEPVFLIGGLVNGGLHGTYPSLTDLDKGDLRYAVDFRQVYASVLEDWFETPHAKILRSEFGKLDVVS